VYSGVAFLLLLDSAIMQVCPSCGTENPEGFRFCGNCASELESQQRSASAEERKLVTILFCDLVGFTDRSESADPEDVRATLERYHRLVRRELERYGGTVEKFIGDAVMAVFGAPVTHEDDAERAIRAALRVLEAVEEQTAGDDLEVRIGLNSGEAVVSLGARAEHGEALVAGDVVNTASRIQGAAPVGSVAVPPSTRRLTEDLFEFEDLEPVVVKGKVEPLELSRVIAPLARFGLDVDLLETTPLVGREEERMLLEGSLRRAIRESTAQLVTVVGEPGVGKSRLVHELFKFIDEMEELISWRQGRCLPYGDGITFWGLSEIVKAQAGVMETDAREDVARRLATAVAAVVNDESEREWIASRLEPLVGVGTGVDVEQGETFAAWTRFFEAIAATGPLVLIVEDLHWADDPMLAYLEHLVEYARDVPILILATARPELYQRAPGWGGGKRNAQSVALSPLSHQETSLLISSLLEQAVLPADIHALVLEKAGGNPLYAAQFVRMMHDRGLLEKKGSSLVLTSEEVPFPESIQALIASRLDLLDPTSKGILHDASVVGKVFWAGAIAAMNGSDEADVVEHLHQLSRRELVRPARVSSVSGTQEYAFTHTLVRDIAYGQIPRSARADRHLAAASWIEATAGMRAGDQAEILAYHYTEAMDLARSAGRDEEARRLHEVGARYLALAGERALSLDPGRAEQQLRRALDLTTEADGTRLELMAQLAEALRLSARYAEAADVLREIASGADLSGDTQLAGLALVRLSNVSFYAGTGDSDRYLERGVDLLESEPPSENLILAYTERSAGYMTGGSYASSIEYADKAIDLAQSLGLERASIAALGFRGTSRTQGGDAAGLSDLRAALELALEHECGRDAALQYNNLGVSQWLVEGPSASIRTFEEGIPFADRRGLVEFSQGLRLSMLAALIDAGRWNEAIRTGDSLETVQASDFHVEVELAIHRTMIAAYRAGAGEESVGKALEQAGKMGPDLTLAALSAVAAYRSIRGELSETVAVLHQVASMDSDEERSWRIAHLAPIVRAAVACGSDLFRDTIETSAPAGSRWSMMVAASNAASIEAQGDPERAIAAYRIAVEDARRYGSVVEEAHALHGLGRCFLALDSSDEAFEALTSGRAIWSRLQATMFVSETERLLVVASASTASGS
jgi:class 3 adenylate cyclase/tetratricopeptide (TPR) repeat protein